MTRQFSQRAGLLAFLLLALTALTGQANAQGARPVFLKATAVAPKTVTPGQPFDLTVTVIVDAPYHIQANPAADGYIPTEVKLGTVKGLTAGKVVYPAGMQVTIAGDKLSVYEGTIKVTVTVTPDKTLKPGKLSLPFSVHYQGCNDQVCYPPTDAQATVALSVGKPSKKVASR